MNDREIIETIDKIKRRIEQAKEYEKLQAVLYTLDMDYKIYLVPWVGLPDRHNYCEGYDAVLELTDKDGKVLYKCESRR